MVPRCFLYCSPPPIPSRRRYGNGRDLSSITPASLQPRETEKEEDVVTSTSRSISTSSSCVPSKPMVIPTKCHRKALRHHQSRSAVTQVSRNPLEATHYKHDPEALPPAVAALLAVTSIPPPSKRRSAERSRQGGQRNQKQTPAYGSHVGELGAADSELTTGLTSSSLEILLGAPHELAVAAAAPGSDLPNTTEDTVRSLSSDSIPSLENDSESTASSSTPSTPGRSSRRVSVEKRQRALSSPHAQECALDHPLLSPISEPDASWDGESTDRTDVLKTHLATPPVSPRSVFKSNLAASIRALKSAAQSFSNFSTPVVQHDGHLTRSMLAIQPHTTDDKRPLPSGGLPDPVLRRYLNPIVASPAELHLHSCFFLDRRSDLPCTFSIQLQTYRRSTGASKKATAPPVFVSHCVDGREAGTEAAHAATAPDIRQREPRENSDFLRIIVMEMNMRREGKLADNAKGKARLWLPPRAACQRQPRHHRDVPRRWISLVLEH